MTLDQLKYFVAAATYQHIGKAANAVAISPSVISSAIASLEDEFQTKFFEKKGRNIFLTLDGKKMLEKSKGILSEVNNLKSVIKETPLSLEGHFRLGASHFLASTLLAKTWSAIQEKHPALTADLHSMDTGIVVGEVLTGRLDMGICFSPLKHPNLHDTQIHTGELLVVVGKKNPILKKSQKEQLQFLAEQPAVFHKSASGVDICETHPIFDRMGFQPKIDQTFDSDAIAVQSLMYSNRWSFVPDLVYQAHKNDLEVIKLSKNLGPATYNISVISHSARTTDVVLMELLSGLRIKTKS